MTSREAFEVHIRKLNACTNLKRQRESLGGRYSTLTVERAWQQWQAAIQYAREVAVKVCEELEEHYSDYKDTALLNGDIALSNAASGEPRAARAIADAIKEALK